MIYNDKQVCGNFFGVNMCQILMGIHRVHAYTLMSPKYGVRTPGGTSVTTKPVIDKINVSKWHDFSTINKCVAIFFVWICVKY